MKPNRPAHGQDVKQAELELCKALLRLKRPDDMRAFLRDLCTPAELQALVDRWQVVMMLSEGHAYRRIHELTGVSVTTVGRVARYLSDGHGGYGKALNQHK
ncbi:MAG: YerC/YecD family TrpR-related protein [Pseudomonadota bacterium]